MSYYTLLTALGAGALTNAYAAGTTIGLTHIAVGDGNGSAIVPDEAMTALVHERHRVPISSLSVHPQNPNWLVAEAMIPASVGGFTVREIGLFTSGGILLAVGNFPDTYKPNLAEGSGRDLLIRMLIQTSNAAQVNLTIDPAVVMASRQFVIDLLAAHDAAADAHKPRRARRMFHSTL